METKLICLIIFCLVVNGVQCNNFSGSITGDDVQKMYSARVHGGETVRIEQYPYNVFVVIRSGNTIRLCGGVIIGKTWVLTAGHCKDRESDITVYAGSEEKYQGTPYEVKNSIHHPSYVYIEKITKVTVKYDYLLLELKKDLVLSDKIKSISIGASNDFLDGEEYTLTGFGAAGKSSLLFSNKKVEPNKYLRVVRLPLIVRDRCLLLKRKLSGSLGLNEFCAGKLDGKSGACTGDSGSPLVFDNLLMGIVSGIPTSLICDENPEIFSSVPYVKNWIRDVTGL